MVASIGTYGAGMSSVWSSTRTRYTAERDELAIQDRITRGGEASVKHNRVSYIQKNNIRAERAAADGVRFSVNRLKQMYEITNARLEKLYGLMNQMRDLVNQVKNESVGTAEKEAYNEEFHGLRKIILQTIGDDSGDPFDGINHGQLSDHYEYLEGSGASLATTSESIYFYHLSNDVFGDNNVAPDIQIQRFPESGALNFKGFFTDSGTLGLADLSTANDATIAAYVTALSTKADQAMQMMKGIEAFGGPGQFGTSQSLMILEGWENFRNKKDAVLDEAVTRLENNDLAAESKRLAQAQAQKQRSQSATQIALQQMNISAQMMASTANTITNNWNRF